MRSGARCPAWIRGGLLLVWVGFRAEAQEFTLFAGATTSIDSTQQTYSWKLEYRQGLGEHFEVSVSWLNEGHVEDHHRDGYTLQLWTRQAFLDRKLVIAPGVGIFRFYDTAAAKNSYGYENVNGWAGILSLDVAAYLGKRWIGRLQANRAMTDSTSIDTWNFLAGIGYQLTPPEEPGPRAWPARQAERATDSQVTAFIGRTVVNSFGSEDSVAASVEYRRALSRYIGASVSFLYEGDTHLVRRGGLIMQLWFGRAFVSDRLELSIGGGAYIAIDERTGVNSGETSHVLAAIVTPSVAYRFAKCWEGRFNWNRIVTTYDRNTDIFLTGVGFRF